MESADTSRLQAAIGSTESKLDHLRREVDTLNNLLRGAEQQLVQTPSGIPGFNKQWIVPAVTMGDVPADEGGSDFNHPFRIVITTDDDGNYKYMVTKGSITDGTNGAVLAITGLDTKKDPSAGMVMIEGTVDASLVITGLEVTIGDESVKEVELDGDGKQIKIALIIGKITMDTDVTPPVPTAWQGWFSSAMVVHGFLNGSLVKVFAAAPTDSSVI